MAGFEKMDGFKNVDGLEESAGLEENSEFKSDLSSRNSETNLFLLLDQADLKANDQIQDRFIGEKLAPEELGRLKYLQEQIAAMRREELCFDRQPGVETPEQLEKLLQKEKEAMERELQTGVFGPESRFLYMHVLNWVAKQNGTQNMPLLISDRSGLETLPSLFLEVKAKEMLGLSPYKMPTEKDLDLIDQANLTYLERTKPARIDENLADLIRKRELPETWKDRSGDAEAKRDRATELTGLAALVQEYVKAVDFLNKAGANLQIDLPQGASLERDSSGNISKVNLDLPQSLDEKNTIEEKRLRDWVEKNQDQLCKIQVEIDRSLVEGFLCVGAFESSGNVNVDEYDANFNYVTRDYLAEEKDGKIHVTPSTSYWSVPFLSVHNLGKELVSTKSEQTRVYEAGDLVPVLANGKMRLVQAKELGSLHEQELSSQSFWENLSLGADLALSTAMVCTGAAELAVAYRGARYFSGALSAGRMAVGAAITLENAGAKEYMFGRAASELRHLCFALDSGRALYDLGKGSLTAASSSVAGAEATQGLGLIGRSLAAAENTGKFIFAATGVPMSGLVIYGGTTKWAERLREKIYGKHDPFAGASRALDCAGALRR